MKQRHLALLAFALAGGALHAETPTLDVSAATRLVHPGEQVAITYSLTGSSTIAALQWNEDVDSRLTVAERIVGSSLQAAEKQLECSNHRCVVIGGNQSVIGDGPLFTALVKVSDDAALGSATLRLHWVVAASPDALPAELQSGGDLEFTIVGVGAPGFIREGIVNSASFQPGLTPGGLATIFGEGLSDVVGVHYAGLATTFENVSVLVNGLPAPLLSLVNRDGAEQINLQVPFETPVGPVTVEVGRDGARTAMDGVPVFAAQPGIFELTEANGDPVAAMIHSDGRLVNTDNPARQGEMISLYFTGGGTIDPSVPTAALGPVPPAVLGLPVALTLEGIPCYVDFAGYAPESVGLYQINFEVPQTAPSGVGATLRLAIAGNLSNSVSIPIQ